MTLVVHRDENKSVIDDCLWIKTGSVTGLVHCNWTPHRETNTKISIVFRHVRTIITDFSRMNMDHVCSVVFLSLTSLCWRFLVPTLDLILV